MVSRSVISVLLVSATVSGSNAASSNRRRVSVDDARKLVYEAVKLHNPGADIVDSPSPYENEFYRFAAVQPNAVASPMIGYFAVDPQTAQV